MQVIAGHGQVIGLDAKALGLCAGSAWGDRFTVDTDRPERLLHLAISAVRLRKSHDVAGWKLGARHASMS